MHLEFMRGNNDCTDIMVRAKGTSVCEFAIFVGCRFGDIPFHIHNRGFQRILANFHSINVFRNIRRGIAENTVPV
jgi:hypothetical protein